MCKEHRVEEILNTEYDPAIPMPGDFVQVQNSTDALISDGSYGVIEGVRGQKREKYLICFNPSPMPWGGGPEDRCVNSSGGPALYIKSNKLKPTGDVIEAVFYTGRPIPGATYIVHRKVRVFKYSMVI